MIKIIKDYSKLIENNNENNNIKQTKILYSESPEKYIEIENSDSNEDFVQITEEEKIKFIKN